MRKSLQLYRRGATYWWRQLLISGTKKFELRFSLQTSDPTTAKRRAAAMITVTSAVKQMLEDEVRPFDAQPTEKELRAMAKAAYEEQLARIMRRQRETPWQREMHREFNMAYRDLYQFLEDTGGHRPISRDDIDTLEAEGWGGERLEKLAMLSHQHFSEQASISNRTIDRLLEEHQFQSQPLLREIVVRALYPAYRKACEKADKYWDRNDASARKHDDNGETVAAVAPAQPNPPAIPSRWQGKTVRDAMRVFFDEAKSGKTFDGKRRHQALDSAWLLDECSGGKPVYEVTNEHLKDLRKAYEEVPANRGKSSADKGLSLAAWRERGILMKNAQNKAAAEAQKAEPRRRGMSPASAARVSGQVQQPLKERVGLSAGTINRHSGHLKQLFEWLENGEGLPIQRHYWPDMRLTDTQDERDKRLPWTNEEAEIIFRLPVWTGCIGLTPKKRLLAGTSVVHDSAYWLPLMAWYHGVRREEGCKLLLTEVENRFGVYGIRIGDSVTGRVKTPRSKRFVPLHKELIRLGFLDYVEAIRATGHDLLFPELEPSEKESEQFDLNKPKVDAKYGDVIYKLWWGYIVKAAFPNGIEKDIQSFRHSATDGLANASVSLKVANDGIGRKSGNISEDRYMSAASIKKLKRAFDKIPVVTAHLQPVQINLLPREKLRQRPVRRARSQGSMIGKSGNENRA